MVKNLPAMQETRVKSLGWEDPLEKGIGNPLQHSCLGNPKDRGAWRATVHWVTKSQTQLSGHENPATLVEEPSVEDSLVFCLTALDNSLSLQVLVLHIWALTAVTQVLTLAGHPHTDLWDQEWYPEQKYICIHWTSLTLFLHTVIHETRRQEITTQLYSHKRKHESFLKLLSLYEQ